MPEASDRRKHPRLTRHDRLVVKIISATEDASLTGMTMSGSTADLSVDGLRLRTERRLPVGCVLDLWVKLSAHPGTFLFTGVVRWSQAQKENGTYQSGIELQESALDDSNPWRAKIEDELEGEITPI